MKQYQVLVKLVSGLEKVVLIDETSEGNARWAAKRRFDAYEACVLRVNRPGSKYYMEASDL